jgi:hypothetical protein
LALLINVVGLLILRGTLETTKIAAIANRDQAAAALAANKISEKLYISQERPWVSLDHVVFIEPLRVDGGAVHALLRFVLKNVGHSPATNVWVEPNLMLLNSWKSRTTRFPVDVQHEICDDPLRFKSTNIGPVIFPNGEAHIDYSLATSAEELAESRANPDPSSKTLMPYLVGCVDYRFTFSAEHHQSGFIFAVYRKRRDSLSPFLSTENGTVEPDDLILDPTIGSGIRID